jgi:hypothetical protein
VLATGGSDVWNEMTGVNYNAEIWNPTTGQWTVGPPEVKARLYHSTAVLMPDASVLVSGGGAPGPQNNTNMEIYYPPYLYNAAGGFATRPVIDTAPSAIDIGETFGVQLGGAGAISRVALIKTASVSHSWNTEQRFIELTFQQNGSQLNIQAPTKAGRCASGLLPAFRAQFSGNAVDCQDRENRRRRQPQSGGHAQPPQSGQPVGTGRDVREPATVGHRPERRHTDL